MTVVPRPGYLPGPHRAHDRQIRNSCSIAARAPGGAISFRGTLIEPWRPVGRRRVADEMTPPDLGASHPRSGLVHRPARTAFAANHLPATAADERVECILR
jgi:hypothetical protein